MDTNTLDKANRLRNQIVDTEKELLKLTNLMDKQDKYTIGIKVKSELYGDQGTIELDNKYCSAALAESLELIQRAMLKQHKELTEEFNKL